MKMKKLPFLPVMILCYQTKYLVLHYRIVELLESEAFSFVLHTELR